MPGCACMRVCYIMCNCVWHSCGTYIRVCMWSNWVCVRSEEWMCMYGMLYVCQQRAPLPASNQIASIFGSKHGPTLEASTVCPCWCIFGAASCPVPRCWMVCWHLLDQHKKYLCCCKGPLPTSHLWMRHRRKRPGWCYQRSHHQEVCHILGDTYS